MTSDGAAPRRRLPIGAECHGERTHLRVWAPKRRRVTVVVEGGEATALTAEPGGYHGGWFPGGAGTIYRLRLDDEDGLFPDPASRFQPDGPHGPSEVVDPDAFAWRDEGWRGVPIDQAVIYEMHVGTFSPTGDWAGAIERLPALAELGVTVVEIMPVADFPGRFGWGYDGVDLFAPTRLYGRPDEMRAFVDAAHRLGLAVILDVVYNHIGPDGNYLPLFSDSWFTDAHPCEWGDAINYDGAGSAGVREFFIANAVHWIGEYRLDGLRLDATHQIYDGSDEHVLTALGRATRAAAPGRTLLLVTENEKQEADMVRPLERGGYGLDAMWNDDFHHSALVAATGHGEAYLRDYAGTPQELLSAAKWGFLFQGQHHQGYGKRRGTAALELPPATSVNFIQNHDQIANTPLALRGHQLTSPGRWRALTALTLLMPGTPMLFQGQEYGASQPFIFFADHHPELAGLVAKGRGQFMRQFPSLATAELAEPHDPQSFERCRLDWAEYESPDGRRMWSLHRDLLTLRREDSRLRPGNRREVDGSVLGPEALLLRWFGPGGDDRLLLVNLSRDLDLAPAPDPLLAPPEGRSWRVAWSSEARAYGGRGTVPPESEEGAWRLAGHSALLLKAEGTQPASRS